MRTTSEWERWLQSWVRRQLGDLSFDVSSTATWSDLGLGSRDLVALSAAVEESSGLILEVAAAWNYPTVRQLAQRLSGEQSSESASKNATTSGQCGPIAVVGMSCRFPGAGNGHEAFWNLLASGTDAVREVPGFRWGDSASDPEYLRQLGVPRFAGLVDDPFGFDSQYFAISPAEAASMDPQQRMLMEVASDALQDAGLLPEQLAERPVGVFVGVSGHDHLLAASTNLADVDAWTNSGASAAMLANRISYYFDLSGPSMAIDTACSSSLVALHEAVTSIQSGECEAALVGGVNVLLSPAGGLSFSRAGVMAPDGRCKTFDAEADGYVRGEGCGVLVLKPLDTALRDGSRIWGVVRGTAVNTNGHSNGLLAPRTSAQAAVERLALTRSGVVPEDVSYVECHGTGTPLGDPIELEALALAYGRRSSSKPLLVGSVKSNIGHLESAAGMAGVIKVLLAMSRDLLPPSIHFTTPNPLIDFAGFEVVTDLRPWFDDSGLHRAGVSSFGFGGSNAHVILEDSPGYGSGADPVWVFSGQASRWAGMAHDLLNETGFRAMIQRIDPVIYEHSGFSVLDLLSERRLPTGLTHVQPTLFAVQVALSALWRDRGEQPAFVIGHSMGEVAAACVAGILSPEDAARLICHRASLVESLSGSGAMLISHASADQTEAIIHEIDNAWLAGHNSPTTTIVSGAPTAIEEVEERLDAAGYDPRRVDVDFASHCPLVEGILEPFRQMISDLEVLPGEIPLISTVANSHPSDGASHWITNLRQPVLFAEAVAECLTLGVRAFVEVSPHPSLLTPIVETARPKPITVRAGLMRGIQEDQPARRQWRRDADLYIRPRRRVGRTALACGPGNLLGSMTRLPGQVEQRIWRATLVPQHSDEFPAHLVQGRRVVPAWRLLTTLLAAGGSSLQDVRLHSPLNEDQEQEVLTTASGELLSIYATSSGGTEAVLVASARKSGQQLTAPTFFEPEQWEMPDDGAQNALTARGRVVGWARGGAWAALRLELPADQDSALAALLDAGCILPSLSADGPMTPVGVGAVGCSNEICCGVATVLGMREGDLWHVVARDESGTSLMCLSDLAAYDLRESNPQAMRAELTWELTALDCTRTDVWDVPSVSTHDQVGTAADLICEAQRRLEGLGPDQRLAVITHGVKDAHSSAQPACALWGLAGVIAAEQPDRWAGIVDSPTGSSSSRLEGWTLSSGSFVPVPEPKLLRFTEDDVVLVTGAFGGIGQLLIRYLAEHGARAMILTTRGQPDASILDELHQAGVTVWVVPVDLSDRGSLTRWLEKWRSIHGDTISTVFHLAGYSPDLSVADLTESEIERSLSVKAGGLSDLLDACGEHVRGMVFSSAASVSGVPGQGAYAAANALVDGMVRSVVSRGGRWQVINWGPWASVGLAGRAQAEAASEVLRLAGWTDLQPDAALRALAWALSSETTQTVIVGEVVEQDNRSGVWTHADTDERVRLIEEIVRRHLGITNERLSRDRPLAEYGMDSILALRMLRNINDLVGQELPVGFLWDHPSVNAIATALELGDSLDGPHPEGSDQSDPTPTASAFGQLLKEIEEQ